MIPSRQSPLLSAAISYIAEAVRDGKVFSGKAGVCAFQIFISSLAGRYASKFTETSHDLISTNQLSAIAVSGFAFALIRKGFGELGESFGSNFGYGAAVTAAGGIASGLMVSSALANVASSPMVIGGGTAALVPYFPKDGNLEQSFLFPAMNPGCGSFGQFAYGDETLSACIVPRLAQQNTFVI